MFGKGSDYSQKMDKAAELFIPGCILPWCGPVVGKLMYFQTAHLNHIYILGVTTVGRAWLPESYSPFKGILD